MSPSLPRSGFHAQSLKIQYKPDARLNQYLVWLSPHSSNTAVDARPFNNFIRLPEGLTLWRYLPPNLTSVSLLGSCNSAWPSATTAKRSKYLRCSDSERSQKVDKPYLLPLGRRTPMTVQSGFCSKAQREKCASACKASQPFTIAVEALPLQTRVTFLKRKARITREMVKSVCLSRKSHRFCFVPNVKRNIGVNGEKFNTEHKLKPT